MTKIHEEFWRGTLDQALKEFQERDPRGEVTLLVAGLPESSMERFPTLEELESRLKNLIDAGESPSEAARRVAEESAVRRKLIYTLALKLSSKKSPEKT
ncbi:hypothetical protein O6H91_12G031000 [Diphasiastrum complanatum]|nr:hypothetical protein O6H91_12G031000 [Diphasiastrum complanatum]